MPRTKNKKRNLTDTPKTLTRIGMALTLVYAIGVPLLDIKHKISMAIAHHFLDAQHSTTTLESYLAYGAFLPLLIFASLWAYGVYRQFADKGIGKIDPPALIAAMLIFGFGLLLYIGFGLYFGLKYHFVS